MKHSFDTYRLYQGEKNFSKVLRIKVAMKEKVDPEILRSAVNTAIKRYPYFAVRVVLDTDGGYTLIPNKEEVAVLPQGEEAPKLCTPEVNGHMLFVEYEEKDIYFNISHSVCGGRGAFPWVMTNVYQYVKERYHIEPDAPGIRKPDSPLLLGEDTEPSPEMLKGEPPIYMPKDEKAAVLAMDYMNGMFNPWKRDPRYWVFAFRQKDIVRLAKESDASVAALFMILAGKMMDRVLPEKDRIICGEMAHFPGEDIGIPNAHSDLLSHIYINYDRDMLKWDISKLGIMTRGQMILQTDPTVSKYHLRQFIEQLEGIDSVDGLKNKLKYAKDHNPSEGKAAKHGTYLVNYTGRMDWGEVADYVEYYIPIIEGHATMELSSMGDRIFLSFMQLVDARKYIRAFTEVLGEAGIPYRLKGPFKKNLPKHELPKE